MTNAELLIASLVLSPAAYWVLQIPRRLLALRTRSRRDIARGALRWAADCALAIGFSLASMVALFALFTAA